MSKWKKWFLFLVWVPVLSGVLNTRDSIREDVETRPFENFEIAIFALLPFFFIVFATWIAAKAPVIRNREGQITLEYLRRVDIFGMLIGGYVALKGLGATLPIVTYGTKVFSFSLPYLLLGSSLFAGAYVSRRFFGIPQGHGVSEH